MANTNICALSGNTVRDIELKTTQSGTTVANATIAVNGMKEDDTSFIDLVLFGKTAEIAAKYVSKGQKITITGRLQQRSYETKDGQKRSIVEVVVQTLELPPKGATTPQGRSNAPIDDIDDTPIDLSAAVPF